VKEVLPEIWHWTAPRDSIGAKDVSSYYLAQERVVLHNRDAWDLGLAPLVVEQGAHELEGRGEFGTYAWGDGLPGGIVACEVGALSPDETALYLPRHRALAIGDGIVRWEGVEGLTFVPDFLMDDPEKTRAGLRAAYRRLLDELEFEHLLLTHGEPVIGTARKELAALVEA
jgi:hypothetical protein